MNWAMLAMLAAVAALTVTVTVAFIWSRRRAAYGFPAGGGRFLPARAPGANWTWRICEALILAAAGAVVLMLTATHPGTGGLLFRLDELHPDYARVNLVMFVGAAVGLLAAVLIALFRRATLGVIVMTGVLCVYGVLLNAGRYPAEWFVPERFLKPTVRYTINLSNTNVRGADLWVNGVHLGKTPVTTTLDEFLAKVPDWPDPPEDYETDKAEMPRHSLYGTSTSRRKRWIRFELSEPSFRWGADSREPGWRRTFYARIKYVDEFGLATGGSGSGSRSGGLTRGEVESHFGVIFPQRQARLEALLDKARMDDYQPDIAWFNAIETYDEDGWIALREAADLDPRMFDVLDAWATWRYDLDEVTDEKSAWRAFERICDHADACKQYLTPSVAGRAVELLVLKLPAERLVERAEQLIRATGSLTYTSWRMNGRVQFGRSDRPGGVSLGRHRISGGSSGGRAWLRRLPISGFTVAHAIWTLNDLMVERGDEQPNLIQRRVTPQLVYWRHNNSLPIGMQAAAYFGGPTVDQFLLRKERRRRPLDRVPFNERMWFHGAHVSRWSYLLANLNDAAGDDYRRRHAERIMDMADRIVQSDVDREDMADSCAFLFHDLHRGDDSLAARYWPRYKALVASHRTHALRAKWQYLVLMEPVSTTRMYVDAWREFDEDYSWRQEALSELDALPPARRQAVIDALLAEVREGPAYAMDTFRTIEGWREYMTRVLEEHATNPYIARKVIAELQEDRTNKRPLKVANWLAHTRPDHPLVRTLAESKDPTWRLMVMGALKEHPTPTNRAILAGLLNDADPAVQVAAKEVDVALRSLAAEDPMAFASAGPQ